MSWQGHFLATGVLAWIAAIGIVSWIDWGGGHETCRIVFNSDDQWLRGRTSARPLGTGGDATLAMNQECGADARWLHELRDWATGATAGRNLP